MSNSDKLIMVVDDEPTMGNIIERLLKGEGYRVAVAKDGKKAIELFEKQTPDVVLLDLTLPGMNGQEICCRMREMSETTKIIYFSAKAAPNDRNKAKALENEADGFIAKPATSKQILAGIQKVLESAQ